ncbi:hypothetical protein K435DRAFT_479331 [Dendrothele bispora CBS 962.96]|uniref:Uncharacterized protein n=1 Tax=Dendrothele bispora (strain CBS 962.96) TaxID=1314807 RepID=A0A4S8MVK1_DENBC|nr:hypothetical protein K435DRAFT_479331 [Dendrothele bispora CBS 962.96]
MGHLYTPITLHNGHDLDRSRSPTSVCYRTMFFTEFLLFCTHSISFTCDRHASKCMILLWNDFSGHHSIEIRSFFYHRVPSLSQSVSDLERILVQAQKVDKNWNQTKPDVPKFKTIRQLSIESVAPAIQLLRGRYLLVGLAKSLSLYDLERSDASWDEPICIVDTVNDTEFDSKLGLSNSVEWYLNEETGSVMYAATLATKISPTEHEIEVEKMYVSYNSCHPLLGMNK